MKTVRYVRVCEHLLRCTNVDVNYLISSSVGVITVVILTQLAHALFSGLRFVRSNSVRCRRTEQQSAKMPRESHSDTGTDNQFAHT